MTTLTSICYHYIARNDEFKRIHGHSFDLLKEHIKYFLDQYNCINPENLLDSKFKKNSKNILITFDDGLKEHYTQVAPLLDQYNIKAIFAIPTCILKGEPANPQIIHFTAAYYGIRELYVLISDQITDKYPQYSNLLPDGANDLSDQELLRKIKTLIKRDVPHVVGRDILLKIYKDHLAKDFPDFMERIHMSMDEIIALARAGHTIAVHTYSHPVVTYIENDPKIFDQEVIQPQQTLSDLIKKQVNIFAYPFGSKNDIFSGLSGEVKNKYKILLTTYLENSDLDLLNLGRYCSWSKDSIEDLHNNLWHYKVSK